MRTECRWNDSWKLSTVAHHRYTLDLFDWKSVYSFFFYVALLSHLQSLRLLLPRGRRRLEGVAIVQDHALPLCQRSARSVWVQAAARV